MKPMLLSMFLLVCHRAGADEPVRSKNLLDGMSKQKAAYADSVALGRLHRYQAPTCPHCTRLGLGCSATGKIWGQWTLIRCLKRDDAWKCVEVEESVRLHWAYRCDTVTNITVTVRHRNK